MSGYYKNRSSQSPWPKRWDTGKLLKGPFYRNVLASSLVYVPWSIYQYRRLLRLTSDVFEVFKRKKWSRYYKCGSSQSTWPKRWDSGKLLKGPFYRNVLAVASSLVYVTWSIYQYRRFLRLTSDVFEVFF